MKQVLVRLRFVSVHDNNIKPFLRPAGRDRDSRHYCWCTSMARARTKIRISRASRRGMHRISSPLFLDGIVVNKRHPDEIHKKQEQKERRRRRGWTTGLPYTGFWDIQKRDGSSRLANYNGKLTSLPSGWTTDSDTITSSRHANCKGNLGACQIWRAHNSNQETRSLIILLRTVVTFMARPLLSGGVEGNSTNQKDDDENYLEGGGPHV